MRAAGIGALAGIVAGGAAGLGSRLAMRISALATEGNCATLLTENGNRCGEITLGGTLSLVAFGALFFGVLGGLFYAVARPWLPWPSAPLRGLVFGLGLLAFAGWTVFDPHNIDFARFGPPLLNIATFATLFPLFGIVVALLHATLDRRVPPLWPLPRSVPRIFPAALVVIGTALAALGVTGLVVTSLASGDVVPALTLGYLLAVLPLARVALVRRSAVRGDPRFILASYALLAAPVLVGGVFTLRGVFAIAT